MKQLCIFLSVMFLLFACATKRKTKDVEKTEIKTENVIQNDSVFQLKSKVYKTESNQTFNEFEKVLRALDMQYDGEQGNELNVTLNHTENGTELNVKGKGKANYNEQTEKTKSLTRNEVIKINDSLRQAELKHNKAERSQQLVDSFKYETDKSKVDTSFWLYITIGGIIAIAISLYIILRK